MTEIAAYMVALTFFYSGGKTNKQTNKLAFQRDMT